MRSRDERDMSREVSPLVAAADAVELDTSELSVHEVVDTVQNIAILRGLM